MALLTPRLRTDRSVDPDDEIVGRRAVAAVDDLNHVIAGLSELAAVFAIGRDRVEQERLVRVEDLVLETLNPAWMLAASIDEAAWCGNPTSLPR